MKGISESGELLFGNGRGKQFLFTLVPLFLFNALVLAYFHNRFWWPPDEGAYAHTAERIFQGEALNSDVEEIHTGYLNFIHAACFRLFGVRLVSLRYPLVTFAWLQSFLIFLIFAKRSLLVAAAAAIASVCLGVTQFLNPQPSWYCLFLVSLVALFLTRFSSEHIWLLRLVGFLVGLVFLFRQVTGVFVGMATLTYLLSIPQGERGTHRDVWIARTILSIMLVGTLLYLYSATDLVGVVLFGIWPVITLVQAISFTSITNKVSMRILVQVALGCALAALPIVTYHLWHHSMRSFLDDTFLRALTVSKFSYMKEASFVTIQSYALQNILNFYNVTRTLNGFYWTILPCVAAITGFVFIRRFLESHSLQPVGPLPILAIFYGMVAILHQIPIYLYYCLPLSLAGLFWLTVNNRRWTYILCSLVLVFSMMGLYYHAGQPISRLLGGTIRGDRMSLVKATSLERTGLWIEPESLKVYTEVVDAIKTESQPSETIFVIPNDPELYFLAQRRNPFRFWNSAIGMRNWEETAGVIRQFKLQPPRLVVIDPLDRNNNANSAEVIAYVRNSYQFLRTVSNFQIYRAP